jgi:sacsin
MAHLSALWPSLSPAEVARLRGAAFVPVSNATRLVAPERLFTRCRVDCTPLAYELPPGLAQHADAMRGLGARDVPRPADVMALLVAAAASTPGVPLGPDELRAALRCAALLAEEGASNAEVAEALRRGVVPVPDAAGVLAPAAQCVRMVGARASLRRHLTVALLRPVHAQLAASAAMCAALSVPLLADIVVEELVDTPDETAEDQLAKSYRGRICSPAFVDAAAAAAAVAGSTLSYHEVEATMHAAAARLAFVPSLRVRLLLLPARTDVTRRSVGHDAVGQPRAFFDDKAGGGKLFVAHPPPHTAPADTLAAALSDLLGAPLPLPLSSLLACADEAVPAVSAALIEASSPGGLAVCASCEPGALVSDAHATLLQCLPLRPFCAGETCAWREAEPVRPAAEAARAAALARAAGVPPPAPTQPQARYVRVLADARAPPGEALYRVSVEVAPGLSRSLLSTDLLSFRATRAGGGAAAASVPWDTAPDVLAPRTAVAPSEAARAVQQLLAASNLPLDLDRVTLVEQTLAAQAALRAAQADAVASKAAASASAADLDALSRTLVCPITQALFEDPVICGDGHTYSRAAIERWFAQGHHTSPMSNKRLADKTLIPNHALKSVIAALNERK